MRVAIEKYFLDQYLYGPAWGKGRERRGHPCPEAILELQVAEKTNWAIQPTGLVTGPYDEQDAAWLIYWQNVMSFEASMKEKYEDRARREQESRAKRKR